MKYYIVAGEASGDLHASNLIYAIKEKDPNAVFRFWGGDLMAAACGEKPIKHFRELAFMGFWEVALNLRTILKNISFCKKNIKKEQPDVLILVDYPGFNLRIAKFAKMLGIKVVYYISPQLWAWKESRVKIIKKYVDQMLVILPFEQKFYQKHKVNAHFVGHPLLDALHKLPKISVQDFKDENKLGNQEIIALLPGSRKQEVEKMLKIMLSIRPDFPNYQFVIAGAPGLDSTIYTPFLDQKVHFVSGKTYDLLRCSRAALVTSGTATLETALLGIPEVVCYRGSAISFMIAKRLVKHIRFISLVNLILNREAVKELIQDQLNTQNLSIELKKILEIDTQKIQEDYKELHLLLGGPGASKKSAEIIVNQ